MTYIDEFEFELMRTLETAEDYDAIVAWVSVKILESYRNGIKAGRKGATAIREGKSGRKPDLGKAPQSDGPIIKQ